jgi:hypothetical protein
MAIPPSSPYVSASSPPLLTLSDFDTLFIAVHPRRRLVRSCNNNDRRLWRDCAPLLPRSTADIAVAGVWSPIDRAAEFRVGQGVQFGLGEDVEGGTCRGY